MNRLALKVLRQNYRWLRREDAKWSADPYAARNTRQTPPDNAGRFLRALPDDRTRAAVAAAPVRIAGRLPAGPRATWYRNWAPGLGRYARCDLSKRVALRQMFRQIAAHEIARHPLMQIDVRPLHEATFRLEAGVLRSQAERAHRKALEMM